MMCLQIISIWVKSKFSPIRLTIWVKTSAAYSWRILYFWSRDILFFPFIVKIMPFTNSHFHIKQVWQGIRASKPPCICKIWNIILHSDTICKTTYRKALNHCFWNDAFALGTDRICFLFRLSGARDTLFQSIWKNIKQPFLFNKEDTCIEIWKKCLEIFIFLAKAHLEKNLRGSLLISHFHVNPIWFRREKNHIFLVAILKT